uniref:Uncharacterized protein n=1 Tax=Proboscia inermis TaxID=420281 RepID=A0A7S0C7L1_9STRA
MPTLSNTKQEEKSNNANITDPSTALSFSSSQYEGVGDGIIVAPAMIPDTATPAPCMFYYTSPLMKNSDESFPLPSSTDSNETINSSCTTQPSSCSSTASSSSPPPPPVMSCTNGPATTNVLSNNYLLNADLSDSGDDVPSDDNTSIRSAATSSNNDEKSKELESFDLSCQFVAPLSSPFTGKEAMIDKNATNNIFNQQHKNDVQLVMDGDANFNWSPTFIFPSDDNLLFLAGNGAGNSDYNYNETISKCDNSLMDLAMLPDLPIPIRTTRKLPQ